MRGRGLGDTGNTAERCRSAGGDIFGADAPGAIRASWSPGGRLAPAATTLRLLEVLAVATSSKASVQGAFPGRPGPWGGLFAPQGPRCPNTIRVTQASWGAPVPSRLGCMRRSGAPQCGRLVKALSGPTIAIVRALYQRMSPILHAHVATSLPQRRLSLGCLPRSRHVDWAVAVDLADLSGPRCHADVCLPAACLTHPLVRGRVTVPNAPLRPPTAATTSGARRSRSSPMPRHALALR
jgi:hypothetical protein